ncbi:MAG TPA: hypothetical protein VH092_20290, partial [Urbifossiella sp.]|nr:hypothetical protein [Urbifossiella sp.]
RGNGTYHKIREDAIAAGELDLRGVKPRPGCRPRNGVRGLLGDTDAEYREVQERISAERSSKVVRGSSEPRTGRPVYRVSAMDEGGEHGQV